MIKVGACGFSISAKQTVALYQYKYIPENKDYQLVELMTYRIGDFSLFYINDEKTLKEIFQDTDYSFGIEIQNHRDPDESEFLGFEIKKEAYDFLKIFQEHLIKHFEDPLRIED